MTAQMFFIGFFGLAGIWFGIVVFRTYSMVRSALALLFSQTALGAMFLSMEAEFLGVLQIMMNHDDGNRNEHHGHFHGDVHDGSGWPR